MLDESGFVVHNSSNQFNDGPAFVTKPSLPPLEQFLPYLNQIWESQNVTNGGRFHAELEERLALRWNVPFVSLFTNGTLGLVTAIQALKISGEVITTPFTFAATTHAITWNGLTPVFADINPKTMNLDPKAIEAAITPRTEAILAVHCYGVPCDVDRIDEIAQKYRLKVIYDAAHAFDVSLDGQSILGRGDLSVISFHATKVFNTFEGGAVVSHSLEMKQRIDDLKNFGIRDQVTVADVGINAKMNEFSAALGLVQLSNIDSNIAERQQIDAEYRKQLQGIGGIELLEYLPTQTSNFSYFPIFVNQDFPLTRDELFYEFEKVKVFARRYFYPLMSDSAPYRDQVLSRALSVAKRISSQVLCLPIYPGLTTQQISRIVAVVQNAQPK